MTDQQVLEDIKTHVTVPVWPHLGVVDGRSRQATYQAVKAGEYEGIVLRVGRSWRVITSRLRAARGIGE